MSSLPLLLPLPCSRARGQTVDNLLEAACRSRPWRRCSPPERATAVLPSTAAAPAAVCCRWHLCNRRPAWPPPPCAAALPGRRLHVRPPQPDHPPPPCLAARFCLRSWQAAGRRPERRRRVREGAAVEQERGVTREAAAVGVGRRRKGIGRGGRELDWRLGFHRVIGFVLLRAW